MISMIHDGHMGVVKMNAIARSHVLWSGIDADIHECAKKCCGCMNHRNTPPEAQINSWEFPVKLWQNIHVVFAGPFLVSMFQIVVDAHSKWSEVLMMNRTVAALFAEILRFLFAINGLSEHLISGIRHSTSSHDNPKEEWLGRANCSNLQERYEVCQK